MKKYFALILLFFTVVACTGIEQVDPIDEPDGPKTYTMTVKAAKDVDTKALSLDGKKLNALWAENDAVKVYKGTTEIGTLYAQSLSADGKSCTLKGRLDTAPTNDETLTLKYHSDIYTGQDGTLDYIAGNCDYAEASVTVNVDGSTGDVTTTAPAAFVNKQAIVKFTFKDSADPSGNTFISPSVIEVEASYLGTAFKSSSFTIPSETYTTNGAGIIYLALPSEIPNPYASHKDAIAFNIKATVGANTYTFTKTGFPFVNGKYFDITVKMAEVIGGKFSVSATKQVYFSKGNLQATGTVSDDITTWTWKFAEHQWDKIGGKDQSEAGTPTGNNNIIGDGKLSESGTVDLFGWSTAATHLGIHNSTNNSTYSGDFVDWGSASEVTACIGTGWRTLSNTKSGGETGEWEYLLTKRNTTSAMRFYKAQVNGVNGLILFPDDWKDSYHPLTAGYVNNNAISFESTIITASEWNSDFEANGAVFLPVAGQRHVNNNYVEYPNGRGHYWSSTPNDAGTAYRLYFTGSSSEWSYSVGSSRRFGYAVRLVRDAN